MRRVAGAVALLVLLTAFTRVFVLPPSDSVAAVGPVDAVIVLGGGIRDERVTRAREVIAAEVAAGNPPPALVLSLPYGPPLVSCPPNVTIAGTAVTLACFVPDPLTTAGEAAAAATLARNHGWRSVGIVTSTYHLARAGLLFDRCFRGGVARFEAPVSPAELRLWWNVAQEIPSLAAALTFDRAAC